MQHERRYTMENIFKGCKSTLILRKSTFKNLKRKKRRFTIISVILAAVTLILGVIVLYNYITNSSILLLYPYDFKQLVLELVIIFLGFLFILLTFGHYSKHLRLKIIYWEAISEENRKSARYAVKKFGLSQDPVEIIADEDVLTSEQVSLIEKHGAKLFAQIFWKKILVFIEEPDGTRHNVEYLNDYTYFINSYIPAEPQHQD